MRRAVLLAALLAALLPLFGCGYGVVEDKRVTEIGIGDTYVAPRQAPAAGEFEEE